MRLKFAFLVYVSRSGSTLIARNLAAHARELLVLPEFRLMDVLMAEGEDNVRAMSAERLARVLRIDRQIGELAPLEEIDDIAAACAGRGIRAVIETLAERYLARHAPERAGATTALIKLGTLVYVAEPLLALFPEARFIHTYRDPRGVASSMLHNQRPYFSQQKMGRGDPVYIAGYYARFMKAVRALAERAPVHEVRYERFCAAARDELVAIAEFLGIAYQDEAIAPSFAIAAAEQKIHRLVDKPPALERVNAWQTELPAWAGLAIERRLGPLLSELGYEPHFVTRTPPREARWLLARAQLSHARLTAEHYLRRLAFYRSRPSWLGNRLKLALRRARA